jgi:hypothetical protein
MMLYVLVAPINAIPIPIGKENKYLLQVPTQVVSTTLNVETK